MIPSFFYGTLCHAPLLDCVLGRETPVQAASLADHAVYWADGQPFPLIVAQSGGVAQGVLLADVSAEDQARLDYYEGGFDYETRVLPVQTPAGVVEARVFFPQGSRWQPGLPWSLTDWQARWGDLVVATAGDVMALRGRFRRPRSCNAMGRCWCAVPAGFGPHQPRQARGGGWRGRTICRLRGISCLTPTSSRSRNMI